MPSWNNLFDEIKTSGTTHDIVRRKYLKRLHLITGRNIIVYYSAWLQKPDLPPNFTMITDSDKTGFMTVVHNLDRSKGLDLIIHCFMRGTCRWKGAVR